MITYPNLSWRIPDLSPPPPPSPSFRPNWGLKGREKFFWKPLPSISGSGSPSLDPPLLTFLDLHHHLALSNNCFIFIQNISLSLIGSNTSANSWRTVRFPVNGYSYVTAKGSVIIYRLGGEGKDYRGDHMIFGREKGGISRNWEPKRGNRWKLWKDSEGGTTQICLENEDIWGGGSPKSSKVIKGDLFSEVTLKGRDWLNFTLCSLKSFAPLPPPGDK